MFKFLKNQRGQVSTMGLVGIGVATIIAIIGGWMAENNITDARINNLRLEQQTKIEKLSDGVSKLNTNVALICQALKIKCRE